MSPPPREKRKRKVLWFLINRKNGTSGSTAIPKREKGSSYSAAATINGTDLADLHVLSQSLLNC